MDKGNISLYEITLGHFIGAVLGRSVPDIPYDPGFTPVIRILDQSECEASFSRALAMVGARFLAWRYVDPVTDLSLAGIPPQSPLLEDLGAVAEQVVSQVPDYSAATMMAHLYDHLLVSVHEWSRQADSGEGDFAAAACWASPGTVWQDFVEALRNGELGTAGAAAKEIALEQAA